MGHGFTLSLNTVFLLLQVKADRGNKKLNTLLQASRHVNDMAAVVVTSTKAGQMQIEDKGELQIFAPLKKTTTKVHKAAFGDFKSQTLTIELSEMLPRCQAIKIKGWGNNKELATLVN